MRSADEVEVVSVEELGDDVGAEGEGDAAVVLAPPLHVFVRVGPQQVAQQAGVGDVGGPHDPPGSGGEIQRIGCGSHLTCIKSPDSGHLSKQN